MIMGCGSRSYPVSPCQPCAICGSTKNVESKALPDRLAGGCVGEGIWAQSNICSTCQLNGWTATCNIRGTIIYWNQPRNETRAIA